ncbi:hypothetical protein ACET3Z_032356 [Daucus carota]
MLHESEGTAAKECIQQLEYSGSRTDEGRFEEQKMGEVQICTTRMRVKENENADLKSFKIAGTKDSNKNSFDQSAVVENCSVIGQKVWQPGHPKVDSSKERLSATPGHVMKYEDEDSRFAATKLLKCLM